jgi:pilus assembly protein CpaC
MKLSKAQWPPDATPKIAGRTPSAALQTLRTRVRDILLLAGLALCASVLRAEGTPAFERIQVGSGMTHMIDTTVNIDRVSIAAPEVAEAVPVSARTVMINGKAQGETSLVVWLNDGTRRQYDVTVGLPETRLDAARRQLQTEFGDAVGLAADNQAVYLTGKVRDLYGSQRALSIAATLGRVVNLLKVEAPPQETQILLKVRFADVDRTKSLSLGINFAGAPGGFPFSLKTGATSAPTVSGINPTTLSLSDTLNLLFFDPHLNLEATLQDLASKAVLQILAEPNVLALNGHQASFVSGGEFPYPTLQGGGSGLGQVTIQFRQFGIQLQFLPTITPRGTIRLHVTPEVSSLDYADALTVSGFTIPALTTRRVDTDVELQDGQSFAIAGLLDRETTDSWSRIPGLADIPLIGKLFEAKSSTKTNSELLVIITPQIVAPLSGPDGMPQVDFPVRFMEGKDVPNGPPPQTPGPDKTGPPPAPPRRNEIPVQEMERLERDRQLQTGQSATPGAPSATPGLILGIPVTGAPPAGQSPAAGGPNP